MGTKLEEKPSGLIVRERSPENLEFPFESLSDLLTANNLFFVRSHFDVPKIEVAKWRLTCSGYVEREVELTYEDLLKLPSRTVTSTMECAGNGRVFLDPKADGVQWERGAVGTAEWTGVPLSVVLNEAGLKDGAVEVVLSGLDEGELAEPPKTPGKIHFARSLPLTNALQDEVILAYLMNGEKLPADHGFPLRAIVPGWYGMASVKWLGSINVVDQPFRGYWQTAEYSQWKRTHGEPVCEPVTEMQVKSQIAQPCRGERVRKGTTCLISGAAWSGSCEVAEVEVSTDGGTSWSAARLLGESVPFSWRFWEYDWEVPNTPGECVLMSRATDAAGASQPSEHSADHNAYIIHHTLPLEVEIV